MKLKTEESVVKTVWFVIGFAVLLVGSGLLACYDHNQPNIPCSVNINQEGCPDWPSDAKKPHDAGAQQ